MSSEYENVFLPLVIHFFMLDYLREIFHYHGCDAKWLLYLDVDVLVTDLSRPLESVIFYANNRVTKYNTARGHSESAINFTGNTPKSMKKKSSKYGCNFIAQLGPHTINTGVLFFRINLEGERFLLRWIKNLNYFKGKGIGWQFEQVRVRRGAVLAHPVFENRISTLLQFLGRWENSDSIKYTEKEEVY